MMFGGAQYQPCVWLQADIACPRQESSMQNGLYVYERPETVKLYPKSIVTDFTEI